MNKENGNPVKLYAEISTLLHDHQDLVDDFASFLLAHQAVECGCFVPYFQYQQLRDFFRKLEIYCDNTTTPFQRTLKLFSKWLTQSQDAQLDAVPFKERFSSVLKYVPGILDELLDYYLDGPLPDSFSPPDEFEEVNLEATSRPLIVIYPHEEKEKLKKAKREAAQLALAKAKAQKSRNKKNKTKGSSQNAKSKRLSIKRRHRRRLPKPRKELIKEVSSDRKTSSAVEISNLACSGTNGTKINDGDAPFQSESHTINSHNVLNVDTQANSTYLTSDKGKAHEIQGDIKS
ncbi:GON-4-like protein [Elysia marginata]|uniref:GON-4-like protein n=1 Tax=Elysia marginata TaxID=1093978 RepID=A0AAV4IDK2_9GAST|nr:GON-4-like protein [Elysia marginata]